jgi:Protein of unknown function (DUF2785)
MINLGATFVLAASVILSVAEPRHSVAFWRQIVNDKYTIPPGSDVTALTNELLEMLASPDAELRDDIAAATLATWIYQTREIDADALRPVVGRLLENLTDGVGERGTNRIFKRSFSALTLSVVVARDNAAPFLTSDEWRRIEHAALGYLRAEQDLRGYDPEHGWMHSAAHTADLLKFIARSRFLDRADQRSVLEGIADKLKAATTVLTHGEDERFARAVLSIVNRADFDRDAFAAWTSETKPPRLTARPSAADLIGGQNEKNLLAKLDVLLDADPQPSDAVQAAHASVRSALKDLY